MPRKTISQPLRMASGVRSPANPKKLFAESTVNGGMVTMVDPADIDNKQLQLAKDAVFRFDRVVRRYGLNKLEIAKPDAYKILKFATLKKRDGSPYSYRFTPVGIHVRTNDGWTPLTGTLNGNDNDRIQATVVLDEFIFANNGANFLQQIDATGESFGRLGNAPPYRYVTGFYNRAVGAALIGDNEVQVGWSADGNAEEWLPDTDPTAGFSPILESPSDLSDFITGIFGFTNVMILLRERSVWLATKQPIPTNPFNFYTAVPGIGCDAPHSATIIPNGIAWLDRRTATVYAYTPGAPPEPIGRPVERSILENVDDPSSIFSSYAPIQNELVICIPLVGSKLVRAWTYNFRYKVWSYAEYEGISSLDDTDISGGSLITIDQLAGIIEDLQGTIDQLSPAVDVTTARVFGRLDGELAVEDPTFVGDIGYQSLEGIGRDYNMEVISKAFTVPNDDVYIAEVRIEYQADSTGFIRMYYSKTGGTDDTWKLVKTQSNIQSGDRPSIFKWITNIRTRRFAFKIESNALNFAVLGFEVHIYPSGESQK